jgi:hypothetical protein
MQRRRAFRRAVGSAALLLALTPARALAQPAAPEPPAPEPAAPEPPAPEPPAPEPPALSPEEQAEIERALAADTTAREAAGQVPDDNRLALPQAAPGSTAAAFLPDIALILDVALAAFSDEDRRLQTGGHDPSASGFNLQQLEMSLGKSVDPYLRFDANIVFAQTGVEIEEAYATTLAMPWGLQARVGQMLTRFGRLNATHPHGWAFVDQPFYLGEVFGAEGNRGLGAELSWLTPLPWYVELVVSGTDASGEGTARSFGGAGDVVVEGPHDLQNTLAVKQFFDLSDDWSLAWGLSAANGPNPTGRDTRTDVYGSDVFLKWRPISSAQASAMELHLQAEGLARRRQVPGDVLTDWGGYAYVFWKVAQRWGTAFRFEHGSATYDGDLEGTDDPLGEPGVGSRQRWSANVTFWPTEFSRLRLQGSRATIHPDAHDPVWAGFLALEVVVGSHGAHTF